ncbi:hypothetical protein AAC387_Pa09g0279 [Persea americana]
MGRAPCCEKVGLKRGRWTAEEDEILMTYIQANGEGSWRSLPKNAGLLRCGKSCRLRWINYLRADLKRGNISPEEEEIIIKLHGSYGNRWSLIAGHLPGRTDNEIKNYWNSHLSRRIHTFRRHNNDGAPLVVDIGKITGGCKRKGGRTSRSAMKKNNPNVQMRRENPYPRSWGPSTTPLLKREALKDVSKQNDKKENMVKNSYQANEVVMGTCQVSVNDVLNPHEGAESGLSDVHVGMEGGSEGSTEERGVVGSAHNDDRENEVMGSNEESKENGGVLGVMDGRCESGMGIDWCSSLDACFEEMGDLQEELLGWEWEGMEEKQWEEEGGDLWSWLWGSDNEEEFQAMGSCAQDKYAAWLLSAETNDL